MRIGWRFFRNVMFLAALTYAYDWSALVRKVNPALADAAAETTGFFRQTAAKATDAALQSSPELRKAAAVFFEGDAMLAVSWQPAFCELNPSGAECSGGRLPSHYDASHFALHGLWPQPKGVAYCGVSRNQAAVRNWFALPEVHLEGVMRAELAEVMPGTRSGLDRHEWLKHGTCYAESPEVYFGDALKLMRELNNSAVRNLFVSRIGKTVTRAEIDAAFQRAFGPAASAKVSLSCARDPDSGRNLIVEMKIALRGKPQKDDSQNLARLMAAASISDAGGCKEGVVDPAGFQ